MRLWRRVVVTSLRPCRTVVHATMLTTMTPKNREFVSMLEIQSGCATLRQVIAPKVVRCFLNRPWTPQLVPPPIVFSHKGYVVPVCCRAVMCGAWDALREAPPR